MADRTHELDEGRLISLEGAFNFRDLGGYPVPGGRRTRWRRLFRSDTLAELTTGDLATLESLGVATVIDLRTGAEVERDGRVALDRVHYAHLSVLSEEAGESAGAPDGSDPAARYLWYLEHNSPVVVEALELVADAERYPLVFHCTAGKDRTGVLAALVLRLLGVDAETVVADYARTAEAMPAIVERLRRHPIYGRQVADGPPARFEVRAESMAGFLDLVDRTWGGVGGWAAWAGLDPAVPAALADLLVEPAPPAGLPGRPGPGAESGAPAVAGPDREDADG